MNEKLKFSKVVHPCDVPCGGADRKFPLFCKIEIKEDGQLSISGVIGPRPSGNAAGSCGQVDMHFGHRNPADDDARNKGSWKNPDGSEHKYDNTIHPNVLRFAPGWTRRQPRGTLTLRSSGGALRGTMSRRVRLIRSPRCECRVT